MNVSCFSKPFSVPANLHTLGLRSLSASTNSLNCDETRRLSFDECPETLKKNANELREIRSEMAKIDSDIFREKNKLVGVEATLKRHGINLMEWENFIRLKSSEMLRYVENFKSKVYYANETQLNRLLFQNNYFSDLNAELFDLEEKQNYLVNVMRQLETQVSEIRNRIDELNEKEEPLRLKHTQLLHAQHKTVSSSSLHNNKNH